MWHLPSFSTLSPGKVKQFSLFPLPPFFVPVLVFFSLSSSFLTVKSGQVFSFEFTQSSLSFIDSLYYFNKGRIQFLYFWSLLSHSSFFSLLSLTVTLFNLVRSQSRTKGSVRSGNKQWRFWFRSLTFHPAYLVRSVVQSNELNMLYLVQSVEIHSLTSKIPQKIDKRQKKEEKVFKGVYCSSKQERGALGSGIKWIEEALSGMRTCFRDQHEIVHRQQNPTVASPCFNARSKVGYEAAFFGSVGFDILLLEI